MGVKVSTALEAVDNPSQCTREVFVEQLLWLIRMRWVAVVGLAGAAVVGSYIFPVLVNTTPIYICAGLLLVSNIIYYLAATKSASEANPKDVLLGMIQLEADLFILTAVLHFSGGVVNPFFLFYLFHVIIATIILPRNLSFSVGLTAILLFGLLAINELNGGSWLGYYPLKLSAMGGLWRNPVYGLGVFVAFACTVVLTQYLTRIIIVRMTVKELEAARNNDLLNAVIGAMSEGLIFVTQEGNIVICNPAAKLWKKNGVLQKEDRKGVWKDRHLIERGHLPGDFPSVLSEHIRGLVSGSDNETEAKQIVEFNTADPDGRHIVVKSCPVIGIDGQKLGYVIAGQDLTEHKRLEASLRDQTEHVAAINEMLKMTRVQMAQREKMVAIGQMAAGIAHEIGNPLASLSSVAQYLGRKIKTHEEKEHLLTMEYQVSRISKILKRMLSLSRPATGKYKWTDINELIDNTLSLIKFDKRMHSIAVKNVGSDNLPMVWLDPQLFEQVLLNIFINALDAMNAKQVEQEHCLEITREFKEEMIEIRVSDTGIGMSSQVAKRAFESFFTTKEIGKGTGLGLFISYNLVTEIDGTIELESEPDKGTTVIIRFPVRPKKSLIADDSGAAEFLNSDKVMAKNDKAFDNLKERCKGQ